MQLDRRTRGPLAVLVILTVLTSIGFIINNYRFEHFHFWQLPPVVPRPHIHRRPSYTIFGLLSLVPLLAFRLFKPLFNLQPFAFRSNAFSSALFQLNMSEYISLWSALDWLFFSSWIVPVKVAAISTVTPFVPLQVPSERLDPGRLIEGVAKSARIVCIAETPSEESNSLPCCHHAGKVGTWNSKFNNPCCLVSSCSQRISLGPRFEYHCKTTKESCVSTTQNIAGRLGSLVAFGLLNCDMIRPISPIIGWVVVYMLKLLYKTPITFFQVSTSGLLSATSMTWRAIKCPYVLSINTHIKSASSAALNVVWPERIKGISPSSRPPCWQ